jgi:hypothetical protein
MARRTLIWHIGLATPARDVIGANLAAHGPALEATGRRVVGDSHTAALATHELLRTHRRAGFKREEVEGQWARICDRVWEHKGVSLLSTPDLCAADKDHLRLALDALIGIEVHLVVTADSWSQQLYGAWLAELRAGRTTAWDTYVSRVLARMTDSGAQPHRQAEEFWAGHELASILARWGWTFHADRLHVVAASTPAGQWAAVLEIAGIAASEDLAPVVPQYADPAGVAVLRKVNRQLDERIPPATSDLLTRIDDEQAAMPVADTSALGPLLERWRGAFPGAGYDVRGDLDALVDDTEPTSLPGPRDQLGVAVTALADALSENAQLSGRVATLEADNERLDQKRRKHKRRLRRLEAVAEN